MYRATPVPTASPAVMGIQRGIINCLRHALRPSKASGVSIKQFYGEEERSGLNGDSLEDRIVRITP